MSRLIFKRVRRGGLVAVLAASMSLGGLLLPGVAHAAPPVAMQEAEDPAAKMYLDVGNPSAGDTVHVGTFIVEGIAFDSASEEGAGIVHVEIFLGDRDSGGVMIGSGVLGVPNPAPDDPQLSDAGWRSQVTIPRTASGPHTLFVYALSAVTGGEIVTAIPVQVAR